jgi:hypothetical protein
VPGRRRQRNRLEYRERAFVPDPNRCLRCGKALSDHTVRDNWIEHAIDDQWIAALRLAVQHGRPVVAELRVFPDEPNRKHLGEWSAERLGHSAPVPEGGLTATGQLRKVKLETYLREALPEAMHSLTSAVESMRVGDELPDGVEPPSTVGGLPNAARRAPQRRVRGAGWMDAELALLARDYVDASSKTRGAKRAVAERWGLTVSQADEAVRAARNRGLLSETTQGKGGGVLRPAAEELIRTERPRRRRRRARG